MQRHDPKGEIPATDADRLDVERLDEDRDTAQPRDRDPLIAGEASGGQPMAVVVDDAVDGATTGDHGDQADDARMERDRAR